jgi:hypothetical protein
MVVVALALNLVISAVELSRGHAEPATWPLLSLSVVALLELLHPRIRSLFTARGDQDCRSTCCSSASFPSNLIRQTT